MYTKLCEQLSSNATVVKFEDIILEKTANIAKLTINRPGKLNAINGHTKSEMVTALKCVSTDDKIRSMIITGARSRAFSVGQDLEEAKQAPLAHLTSTELSPRPIKVHASDHSEDNAATGTQPDQPTPHHN